MADKNDPDRLSNAQIARMKLSYEQAQSEGHPYPEFFAVKQYMESSFDVNSSHTKSSARGLNQLLRGTETGILRNNKMAKGNIFDPEYNNTLAILLDKELLARKDVGGDWIKAMQGYKGGPKHINNPDKATQAYINRFNKIKDKMMQYIVDETPKDRASRLIDEQVQATGVEGITGGMEKLAKAPAPTTGATVNAPTAADNEAVTAPAVAANSARTPSVSSFIDTGSQLATKAKSFIEDEMQYDAGLSSEEYIKRFAEAPGSTLPEARNQLREAILSMLDSTPVRHA